MSMNLHCDEINLWQTPTYITYMCANRHKIVDGKLVISNDNWINIRERYILWVKMATEQQFNNANLPWYDGTKPTAKQIREIQEEVMETRKEHIAEIMAHRGPLHFKVM